MKRISLGRTLATILLVLALAAAVLAKTDHHSFSVSSQFGDRDEFEFEVRDTGTIRVEARWSGSASELALILNGPGQQGYYQRVDGRSPLVVTQNVTREILARGTKWKASIVNFSRRGTATGNLTITYPSGHNGPGGPGGPGHSDQDFDRFNRLALIRVDRTAHNRAVLTVEYALADSVRPGPGGHWPGGRGYGWHDTNSVYLGAALLANGKEVSSFGFQPVRLSQRSGRAQVTLTYIPRSSGLITTDQVAVFLYEGRERPFCKVIHDLDLEWRR